MYVCMYIYIYIYIYIYREEVSIFLSWTTLNIARNFRQLQIGLEFEMTNISSYLNTVVLSILLFELFECMYSNYIGSKLTCMTWTLNHNRRRLSLLYRWDMHAPYGIWSSKPFSCLYLQRSGSACSCSWRREIFGQDNSSSNIDNDAYIRRCVYKRIIYKNVCKHFQKYVTSVA